MNLERPLCLKSSVCHEPVTHRFPTRGSPNDFFATSPSLHAPGLAHAAWACHDREAPGPLEGDRPLSSSLQRSRGTARLSSCASVVRKGSETLYLGKAKRRAASAHPGTYTSMHTAVFRRPTQHGTASEREEIRVIQSSSASLSLPIQSG